MEYATIFANKYLNKKSRNYTSDDVSNVAKALNRNIKVVDIVIEYNDRTEYSTNYFTGILVYHHEHYAAVSKASFRNKKHKLWPYCLAIDNNGSHLFMCPVFCQYNKGESKKQNPITCTKCHRTLANQACLKGHQLSKISNLLPLCDICTKPIDLWKGKPKTDHKCYEAKCINCSELIPYGSSHQCAIKTTVISHSYAAARHLFLSIIPCTVNNKMRFYYACGNLIQKSDENMQSSEFIEFLTISSLINYITLLENTLVITYQRSSLKVLLLIEELLWKEENI